MNKLLLTTCMIAALAVTGCKEEKETAAGSGAGPDTVAVSPSVEASSATIHYQCGDTAVQFTLLADGDAEMRIAEASYAMEQAISASGAKYDNLGDETTYLWNKGDKATVSIKGETLPECVETASPADANTGDNTAWILETLGDAGVTGNSPVTIRFGDDGRVSGNSGCNNYTGNYTREGERLEIARNLVSTRRACLSDAAMAQEQKFLETLSAMTSYATDERGALTLSNDAGQRLVFRKE